jgi:PTH1 family peptidyl-tRNA hydrolase
MTLFVGLGNPGSSYQHTRHNIGWRVIDRLVSESGARDISKTSFDGELYRHSNLFFLKPTTFMNLSGKSVLAVRQFFKIETEDIFVIHDDIDLPYGALRFKKGGGHGGHNGLKSIDSVIGKKYYRVRFGVGKPEYKSQVADYVLHDFSAEESKHLDALINHAAQACGALIDKPFDEVRTHYSRKRIST